MARQEFIEDGIYHVYNRGTDKREIFLSDQDYYRFIYYLYVCNDANPIDKIRDVIIRGPTSDINERERLVNIICYALMPNHFHLLLQQRVKNGISKFIQKLSTGHTMYFNSVYDRSGVLFQGKFKSKFVHDESYLSNLVSYIHLNPLELHQKDWKKNGVKDFTESKEFLEGYRWSSYRDFIGKKNFFSLLDFGVIREFIGEPEEYKNSLEDLIQNKESDISQWLLD